MRKSRIKPRLSAWAQVSHQAFNHNHTPLAPSGTQVFVHEEPYLQETWAPHAVDVWYIGPALNHDRFYRVWIKTIKFIDKNLQISLKKPASETLGILVTAAAFWKWLVPVFWYFLRPWRHIRLLHFFF